MDKTPQKLFLRAAMGLPAARPPLWIMRQAGRYLPEYHRTKERAGGFLNLCKTPELAIEVTLQPVSRFGFDAAILFSDILIPAEAMGIKTAFNPGPVIGNPIQSKADAEALIVPDPEEKLSFVPDILKGLTRELPKDVALIGFAGAPFTTACYLMNDRPGKGSLEAVRKAAYLAPEVLDIVLDKLTRTTLKYLRAQIKAGAEAVQLFDSSAFQLPRHLFEKLALKPAKQIIDGLSDTGVPVIYFAPGAMSALEAMRGLNAHVIGADWRIDLDKARDILGDDIAVQGNLDPAALLGTQDAVKREAFRILRQNRSRPGHIFNLGHGILPDTPIANVEALVEAIREESLQGSVQ